MSQSHYHEVVGCECSDCQLTSLFLEGSKQLRDCTVQVEILKRLARRDLPEPNYHNLYYSVHHNLPSFGLHDFREVLHELVAFDYVRRFDEMSKPQGEFKLPMQTRYAISTKGREFLQFLFGKEYAEAQGFVVSEEKLAEIETLRKFRIGEDDSYVEQTAKELGEKDDSKTLASLVKQGLIAFTDRGRPKVRYYSVTVKGVDLLEAEIKKETKTLDY